MRRRNFLRQIVDHPVCDILDAVEAQQIERFLRLGETGVFHDRGGFPVNCGIVSTERLVASAWFPLVHRSLHETVAHEFESGFERL